MSSTFFMSHSRFQHHPLLAIYCEGLSNCVSLLCQVNPLNSQNLYGPDIGLLEIADENWIPYGHKQNNRVFKETRPFNARYAWPNGVWICHDARKPSSQQSVKQFHCLVDCFGQSKATDENPDRNSKRRNSDINLDGMASWALACNHYRRC